MGNLRVDGSQAIRLPICCSRLKPLAMKALAKKQETKISAAPVRFLEFRPDFVRCRLARWFARVGLLEGTGWSPDPGQVGGIPDGGAVGDRG